MMQDDDKPVDREAWQRVLKRGAGEPPRSTDERIRAEARRAVAPHTGRWWLPASLAASLLLAVLIVQWQYEEAGRPAAVTESDIAAPAAQESAPTAALEGAFAEPPVAADAAAPAPVRAEEPFVPSPAMNLPAASAPQVAGKAAAEMPARRAEPLGAPAQRAASAPAPQAEASRTTGFSQIGELRSPEQADAAPRTPEEWYAEIEALRAAGRNAEADAELARLEEAYPGWLQRHVTGPR